MKGATVKYACSQNNLHGSSLRPHSAEHGAATRLVGMSITVNKELCSADWWATIKHCSC